MGHNGIVEVWFCSVYCYGNVHLVVAFKMCFFFISLLANVFNAITLIRKLIASLIFFQESNYVVAVKPQRLGIYITTCTVYMDCYM